MRVVIIGASGRSGRRAVAHALAAGHEVVSVVRTPSSAPESTEVARADARDVDALTVAMTGADAVISTLGFVKGDADARILREGMAATLEAMHRTGIRRLIAISAGAPYVAGDDPLARFVAKPILQRVLRANNEDTMAMDAAMAASGLDWTSIRPGRLVQGTGAVDYRRRVDLSVRWHYSTTFDTVGRVAVDALTHPDWIGHAVYITE
ncbi:MULTISPECIES: NAD(P)-dependent oxidoreductase [unclassified Microbacterium]|uniref:NAD(P)-dependent oxidoreductase n=1 Tax=unclassified Microbacterium TaxID=2609290 RepID=UPI0012FC831D|nr:NAD(P)H-binding protein [Microbacterium sp. MAH-37]MVQ40853.1 NAD(P)H-binding protein [Microbacterium sp. MAH-37]